MEFSKIIFIVPTYVFAAIIVILVWDKLHRGETIVQNIIMYL